MSAQAPRQLRRLAQEAGIRKITKPKKVPTFKTWKIVRGDKVQIVRGPYKGDQGRVVEVHRKKNLVTVDNTRVFRKAVKATEETAGGLIAFPAKFHVSAVSLIDPVSGKPTRVRMQYGEDGKKVRVSKKSNTIIPKPNFDEDRRTLRRLEAAETDTLEEDLLRETYVPPSYLTPDTERNPLIYHVLVASHHLDAIEDFGTHCLTFTLACHIPLT